MHFHRAPTLAVTCPIASGECFSHTGQFVRPRFSAELRPKYSTGPRLCSKQSVCKSIGQPYDLLMKELHERINRVIHTVAFERALEAAGIELFEFQGTWSRFGKNGFGDLPKPYQSAILAGEKELAGCVELDLA
jgi:hypothetical protein